jgi:ribonuclease BN (tRNA processing enzyme)
MECAFPGSSAVAPRFALTLRELAIGERCTLDALAVTPFHVQHDDRAGPCLALRIEAEGKVVTYSGDTAWTDELIAAARAADLFVCECYTYERAVNTHMSLATLAGHLDEIGARRVVLTHMSAEMLGHRAEVPYPVAEDGLIVEI